MIFIYLIVLIIIFVVVFSLCKSLGFDDTTSAIIALAFCVLALAIMS